MREPDWIALRDLLRHRANRDPGRLAFADHQHQLSYADLAERSGARAGALRAMGVHAGDRVAMAMAAGTAFVEVFWALQLLGAAPCAFNPAVPADTLARRVKLVRPKLVVTDAVAREMSRSCPAPNYAERGPDDLAVLQLTSGTSGRPRVSMILQRNVLKFLRTSRSEGILHRGDVYVSWVPPWHDLGLFRFIVGPVYHGASCHIVEPAVKTIPHWLATIARVRGTYSAAPDFALRMAARIVDPTKVDLASLRFMRSGGEPVRWSSIRTFEDRFERPGVVVPGYGLGEATLSVAEHLPGEHVPVDERGNVSCGIVNPWLEIRAGRSVDLPEEILVRGEAVFAGYLDAPEETSRSLREGWLHTGDSGYLDGDGRLFVVGRREGMIKRAGALIAPRELEEAAQRVSGVRLAAAASIPARPGGDLIVVVVEAEVSNDRPAGRIAADVSREIVSAVGFAPGRVSVLPPRSIPRTENGKVRHGRLRAHLQDGLGDDRLGTW